MAVRATVRRGSTGETALRQSKNNPTKLAVSGTSAQTGALAVGDYEIKADVDGYLKQGANPTAGNAAGTPSDRVYAGETLYRRVTATGVDDKFAGITDGPLGDWFFKLAETP